MARINIEDSLYQDYRFIQLYVSLKSVDMAIGALVRAWAVAQKWYLSPSKMIPKLEWEKQCLNNEIIVCGLASEIDGFIKIAGADDQFSWLEQRVEAGRRGGVARQNKTMPVEERARREGARVVLNKAVKSGEVIKQDCCSICGKTGTEAHHSDYSKPLHVDWLCKKCHAGIHWDIQEAIANQPLAVAKPLSLPPSPSQNTKTILCESRKRPSASGLGINTQYPTEFEQNWKAYGMRGSKKKAFEIYKKLGLNERTTQILGLCISNYATARPEVQYRQHFERFLKDDWRQYERAEVFENEEDRLARERQEENEKIRAYEQELQKQMEIP